MSDLEVIRCLTISYLSSDNLKKKSKKMKWHTELSIVPISNSISYRHQIMAIGSCFTENMGQKLRNLKYRIDINPFGVQYNPASVAQGLDRLLSGKAFDESELFFHQGLWQSFAHHGSFSNIDKECCLLQINSQLETSHHCLFETDFLLLTLGTAWVYALPDNNMVVNNCHKMPASHFKRFRMSVEEVVAVLEKPLKQLLERKPNLNILLTVSPIRHLKDGFHENQLSKATLLLAIEILSERFTNCLYFPAYELLIDDLRDYRFYTSDLLHPNDSAIDYIWEKFEESCLNSSENTLRQEVKKIIQSANHRLLNPDSEESKLFLAAQLKKIAELEAKWPELKF